MSRALLALAVSLALAACSNGARAGAETTSGDEGGLDEATRCEHDAECVAVSVSCCGTCGAATSGDVRALRHDAIQRGLAACEGEEGCVDCFQETSPQLFAVCRAGRCEVVDLGTSPMAACATDGECVRVARGCECGSGVAIVARAALDAYRAHVCAGETPPACEPLAAPAPEDEPVCRSGRCIPRRLRSYE